MKAPTVILSFSIGALLAGSAFAQTTGPSTASTPYVLPTKAGYETISILTVDNTGANPDDTVPKIGGGTYGMDGIPDGLGAFDNGNGTFTLLMNHELGNTVGVIRDHGAKGAYVSKFVINKNTLAVNSGEDLMKGIYRWNTATQASETTPNPFAFARFCSADLPAPTAFFNAGTSLGSSERIFMHGEENSAAGFWQQATVVTGPDAGKSYTLGKFNRSSDHVGGTVADGVGSWENASACPFPQDKTLVIGLNDGGTAAMTNALSVYVGTKTNTGSEVDKAGLTNGHMKFVLVSGAGNTAEIVNGTTRATNIVSGTPFTLSETTSTLFSRPEDGAWVLNIPSSTQQKFYFVTTDRLDQVSDSGSGQVGQTRLWRLNFTDVTNPDLGGTIDLVIDGRTVAGEKKVNMFDNICINEKTGRLILQEDVGGAPHNGKMWEYDPATDALFKIMMHDTARFGDLGPGATAPFNNDEEASGVIDITPIMATSTKHKGNPREAWYISSDQSHYTTGATTSQVEGGQLFVIHDIAPTDNVTVTRGSLVRDRRTGTWAQVVTITNNNPGALAAPFYLALDTLSSNATVANATGTTTVYAPLGSPYITFSSGTLAPGASANVTLQFNNPTNAAVTYTARVLNSVTPP